MTKKCDLSGLSPSIGGACSAASKNASEGLNDILSRYDAVESIRLEAIPTVIEAARRYGDMCKPVDVEAIRYEITDILEGMGVQNLHAVMGGHKITLHLAATGRLNTPATSDAASCSGTNASLNQQAGPADAQGGGADICTTNNVEELFRALDDFCSTKADEECMAFLKAKLRQLLKERAGV